MEKLHAKNTDRTQWQRKSQLINNCWLMYETPADYALHQLFNPSNSWLSPPPVDFACLPNLKKLNCSKTRDRLSHSLSEKCIRGREKEKKDLYWDICAWASSCCYLKRYYARALLVQSTWDQTGLHVANEITSDWHKMHQPERIIHQEPSTETLSAVKVLNLKVYLCVTIMSLFPTHHVTSWVLISLMRVSWFRHLCLEFLW